MRSAKSYLHMVTATYEGVQIHPARHTQLITSSTIHVQLQLIDKTPCERDMTHGDGGTRKIYNCRQSIAYA